MARPSSLTRPLTIVFHLLAIALGAAYAWAAAGRYSMNADGIAYLDIGDAYLRGDWATAINSVWSPLYSWILGAVLAVARPGMAQEFPLAQWVNFAIYLAALASFGFFWWQLGRFRHHRLRGPAGDQAIGFSEPAWLALGYLIFITVSLALIEIWSVTPDMLMSALVYLVAGLIVRMRRAAPTWLASLLLGLALGLGYLAKAIMFPLAFLFLGVGLFSGRSARRNAPGVLLSLLAFCLVSLPYVALISQAKGRPTIGDAGQLTFARHVLGLTYPHWQGGPTGFGAPLHPTRQLLESPPVYEFGAPIGGTYPVSTDPSYWYEGLLIPWDFGRELGQLLRAGLFFHDLLVRQQGGLLLGVVILHVVSRRRPAGLRDAVSNWGLALIALASFAMYAAVYVEGRYVGAMVALLWADLLANVRLRDTQAWRRLISAASAMILLSLLLNLAAFTLAGYQDLQTGQSAATPAEAQTRPPSWPGEVALALQQAGLKAGDPVGLIGYGFDAYWARLGRFKIVAELLDVDAAPFWRGEPELQADVVEAFAAAGAAAIVAEHVPGDAALPGWRQVNDTNYSFYLLEP
ncbi:MAG: hypothetical protein ACRDHL_03715 [Candidatus Promineifilaceae bacterium]